MIAGFHTARFAREHFDAESEILPGCGHNWFSAEGKERIADTLNATPNII